jgi:single-strand DNA-binding protein
MTKGKLISVAGSIQTRTYDAKDGTKRYVTELIADEVDFLEWGDKQEGSKAPNQENEATPIDDGDIPF